MKQFFGCLGFTLLFHILCSFIGGSFDPMQWPSETPEQNFGKTLYVFFELCIWLVPITLNYLNGDENFKD